MTVNYRACDFCGRRIETGYEIDAKRKTYRDGKCVKSFANFDICTDCFERLCREAKTAIIKEDGKND